MLIAGLTGSIAMGKSEAAAMFRRLGHPVFEADPTVHRLYAHGGKAVAPLSRIAPAAIVNCAVDRARLSEVVLENPGMLKEIEAVVHPLVRSAEAEFIAEQGRAGRKLVILDIPLLYESGRAEEMDAVIVVSAPSHVQAARALARPGMTPAKLAAMLERQMPDAEKRRRADYVIETDRSFEEMFEDVRAVADDLLRYASRAREPAC